MVAELRGELDEGLIGRGVMAIDLVRWEAAHGQSPPDFTQPTQLRKWYRCGAGSRRASG